MEKIITIKNEYNSLEKLYEFLKTTSSFECSKNYDKWDTRTDSNGQMAKCILLKKNSMHAIKIFFASNNTIKMDYIIPNSVMNAYFGKSEKARLNIIEVIAEKVKNSLLASAQKKAFEELEAVVNKATA